MARLAITGALLCLMVAMAAAAPAVVQPPRRVVVPRRALTGLFDVFNPQGKTANAVDKAGNKIEKVGDKIGDGIHDTKRAVAKAVDHQQKVADKSLDRLSRTTETAVEKTKLAAGSAVKENVDAAKAGVQKVFTKPFTTDPNLTKQVAQAKQANAKLVDTTKTQFGKVSDGVQKAVSTNVRAFNHGTEKVANTVQRETKDVKKSASKAWEATGNVAKTGVKAALRP